MFTHLHTHSEFSALDGLSRTSEMVAAAVADGQTSMAVTDHGVCAAHPDFQLACDQAGIKPIFGMEAYFVPNRFELSKGAYWHLVLWAMDDEGLKNLWAMSTESFRDGLFDNKAHVDWDMLARLSQGVMCSTACLRGPVTKPYLDGDPDLAISNLLRLKEIFEDRLYIEIHVNHLPEQIKANHWLLEQAAEHRVSPIAVVDSHYPAAEDKHLHEVWLAAQIGKEITDDKGLFEGDEDYHLMTEAEVRKALDYLPEGIVDLCVDNTTAVADRCTARIEMASHNPVYSRVTSEWPDPVEHDRVRLLEDCLVRWTERTQGKSRSHEDYALRFKAEFALIVEKGFQGYFLMVADLVGWAKGRGILVGPGRGCLAGEVPVRTRRGSVPLRDVRVGDEVVTHEGAWHQVRRTFRYDCDETLVHLRAYYDDQQGVTLTADHKVLAEKAKLITDRHLRAQGYRWQEATGQVEWIAAGDLAPGDLVVTPVPPVGPDEDLAQIDLAQYAPPGAEITDRFIRETSGTNRAFSCSQRDVHRRTGLSQNAIKDVVRGAKTVRQETVDRVLAVIPFETLTEWRDYLARHQVVTRKLPRFLPVNEDFCRLLGMLTSNGWLRAKDPAEVGIAVQRSTGDDSPVELFQVVFGLTASRHDHSHHDLTQYRVQSRTVRSLIADCWQGYSYRAQSKSLPDWSLRLAEKKRQALLEGLWWGDGAHSGKSTYSTTSERLRDQLRELLWSLGLPAGVRREVRMDLRPSWAGEHESWTITTTPLFGPMRNQYGTSLPGAILTRLREISVRSAEPVYDLTVDVSHSYSTSSFVVHNSGGGSLVAYLLGITEIDPVEHDVLFERFMTKGRTELPDFDIDFPSSKKAELYAYAAERWGEDHCATVGTHMRLKSKSVIQSIARALKSQLPEDHWPDIMACSDIIEAAEADTAGLGLSWDELWDRAGDQLQPYAERYPQIFELAGRLHGRLKGYGKHPAGVIIDPDHPLTENLPLRRGDDGRMIAQFDLKVLELLGYVKFDLLNIKNLDIIQRTLDLIHERTGRRINPYAWREELDDPYLYEQIGQGWTLGLFQLGTPIGTAMCRRMKPKTLHELADLVTLVRPGPSRSGLTDTYLARRKGDEEVSYADPRMAEVLRKTQGVMIYQEQLMKLCMTLAGYDDVEADKVRKILGKKKVEEAKKQGVTFVARAIANGTDDAVARDLWTQMEEFALYCVSGDTRVWLAASGPDSDGTVTVEELYQRLHSRLPAHSHAGVSTGAVGRPKSTFVGPCVCCGQYARRYTRGYCQNKCEAWYRKFHGKDKGLFALSYFADGRIRPARILDVVQSGEQELFRVVLAGGRHIDATADHRHLTSRGYRRVHELAVGDRLVIDGGYQMPTRSEQESRGRLTKGERQGQGRVNGAFGKDNYGYIDGGSARWKRWKQINFPACMQCGSNVNVQVAHLDGDHQNNVPSNLAWLCQPCHLRYDYAVNDRRRRWQKGHLSDSDEIVSIEFVGRHMTYDVVMEEPHNFVANGIVTHNSFGYAHALAYAILGIWTAWFKFHYPLDFHCAAASEVDNDEIPEYIEEARRMGYRVLPPDVNISGRGFGLGDTGLDIRYGLDAIKGVGEVALKSLLAGQPYVSWEDFYERSGCNSGVVKTLVHLGVLDSLELNRRYLERWLEHQAIPGSEKCVHRTSEERSITWLPTPQRGASEAPEQVDWKLPCAYDWQHEPDALGRTGRKQRRKPPPKKCTRACRHFAAAPPPEPGSIEPYTDEEIRRIEQQAFGVYLSSTPFDRIPEEDRESFATAQDILTGPHQSYPVAAVIQGIRTARNRDDMGFLTLSTPRGSFSVVVFPRLWERHRPQMHPGSLVLVSVGKNSRGCSLEDFIPLD